MKLLLVTFILCILVEQMFSDIATPGPPSIVSDKEYRKQLKVIFLYIHFLLALFTYFCDSSSHNFTFAIGIYHVILVWFAWWWEKASFLFYEEIISFWSSNRIIGVNRWDCCISKAMWLRGENYWLLQTVLNYKAKLAAEKNQEKNIRENITFSKNWTVNL